MATEVGDKAFHSAQSLYLKLLSAFPDYAADFKAKLQSWQEAISPSSEFVPLITDYTLGMRASIRSALSPSTWSSVPEFDALLALGPKAVPLALRHLSLAEGDATAVFLCILAPVPL
jgi:hypothetical protein